MANSDPVRTYVDAYSAAEQAAKRVNDFVQKLAQKGSKRLADP